MSTDLFRAYPVGGYRSTSCGLLPVPYHVYDGEALLLGLRMDGNAASGMVAGAGLHPVVDRKGRALACLWVCQFTQAGIGPHCELQLSLAVRRETVPPVGDGAFELLRLIVLDPTLRLYSAALWNDTPAAVAYNRELLGLDARFCLAHFSRGEEGGFVSFRFEDQKENLIFQGDVAPAREQPIWDAFLAERALGKDGNQRLAAVPWLGAQVMAPAGVLFPQPCEAQAFLQAEKTILTRYSSADAHLHFDSALSAGLDLRPDFIEYFHRFRFVYLPSYNCGDNANGHAA
jgi:hypothetical protein